MERIVEGRVSIVTGAARGIGRATAELLCQHGARVVICDADREAAERTARELEGETMVFAGDLVQPGMAEALIEATMDRWNAIDIIVNNAGYVLNARAERMTDEEWDRMLAIHATVPFRILRAAAPHMIKAAQAERAAGREVFRKIVNVASTAVMGSVRQANYAAAKAALVGLTKSLAKEWGEHLINVNAVGFGSVDTRLGGLRSEDNVLELGGERIQLGLSQKAVDSIPASVPFGRPATPAEAAGAIFMLCTPWSNWVNGQLLMVNGGQVYGMSA
ncbi:SDR family oxidoreductase [Sphingobium indicum]|uniref:3-oxoacyl-ACP reductase n=2 Tax=Sphingobium indicum TaxID=332055 RepID=A0A1L5BKA1_SPHIB|nr:SDR family NAD(P)-dependent oxidoreductase [Sphingobium indicum]EPR08229.1 3-oxoacyl-ACP reductase [Sphingobium indicum IP26]APL93274.1 3-oxoacyl-ACP reductase [Sphingobium indicum B90A]EPR15438.1 3-oxoacyl-ACP reductase [Sphingobium indicum IP26]NYI22069.1 3-oxoacyl-[acyl-carrier protein] reductase [Sphingobium indicum]RYM03185.1 SDR family oxidoreductase [Sphingobium indicum]